MLRSLSLTLKTLEDTVHTGREKCWLWLNTSPEPGRRWVGSRVEQAAFASEGARSPAELLYFRMVKLMPETDF